MKNNEFYLVNFFIEEKFKDLFLDYIESNLFFESISYQLSKSFKGFWFCNLITNTTLKINDIFIHINNFRKNLNLYELKVLDSIDTKGIYHKKLPDENWLSKNKKTFSPIKIDRFVIYDKDFHDILLTSKKHLKINASYAFGTGYHETTKSCIRSICHLSKSIKFKKILDFGSGTGILGIAAKKTMPLSKIKFVDVDKNAIKMTKLNLISNNISKVNNVFNNSKVNKKFKKKKYYDLILANIIFSQLRELIKDFNFLINVNGFLIISGILKSQKSYLINQYRNFYFYPIKVSEENYWTTIIFKKIK